MDRRDPAQNTRLHETTEAYGKAITLTYALSTGIISYARRRRPVSGPFCRYRQRQDALRRGGLVRMGSSAAAIIRTRRGSPTRCARLSVEFADMQMPVPMGTARNRG